MYIRYWLAVVVSFLGDSITLATNLYVVGTKTNSVLMLSAVLIAHILSSVLLGPIIGPFIDRFKRKYNLVIADLYRFSLVGIMFFVHENIYALLVLLFLCGIGRAFFEPARIASIPTILFQKELPCFKAHQLY